MPRRARSIVGGYVYHILNRANGRLRLFKKDPDFAAFDAIVAEAHARVPLRGRKKGRKRGRSSFS